MRYSPYRSQRHSEAEIADAGAEPYVGGAYISDMIHQYRIEPTCGGFEAQMLYNCGAAEGEKWFPINAEGYWSDPDSYSFGKISNRHVFETREAAARAIAKARAINEG